MSKDSVELSRVDIIRSSISIRCAWSCTWCGFANVESNRIDLESSFERERHVLRTTCQRCAVDSRFVLDATVALKMPGQSS